MPIIVSNLRLGLDEAEEVAISMALRRLGIAEPAVKNASLYKKSLDARRRNKISFVVSVIIELYEEQSEAAYAVSDAFVSYHPRKALDFPKGDQIRRHPIVIIGFGPAGIFAAHTLTKMGFSPIVLEQGGAIEERFERVKEFWETGRLNEKSNVQFGEGGAGTFSDGKLTTRISDERCAYVLEQFIRHGADPGIRTAAKPHIGTDHLRGIITRLRQEILELGGEIRFNTPATGITLRNNRVYSVKVGDSEIRTDDVILAVGHSARDTFQLLMNQGVYLEPKNFSVGVRIEQLQSRIDRGLYGELAGHPRLPRGEYQLSAKRGNRCVYTFCMCPGGYVVPSSSETGQVVTNGMSEHARDGKNANAALVVSVGQEDFGSHPLAGMYYQAELERRAFQLGGGSYSAPAMTVDSFLNHKPALLSGEVSPSYSLGVVPADFDLLFSQPVTEMLRFGLQQFQKKLPGFSYPEGILTGVETRTSSPVRIARTENGVSRNTDGLYPCGEGAGYAGGIMSAAVDGIRIAQQIISKYQG